MKIFRNLIEAINSLEKGKVLISTEESLFNKKLAFYQKDIFENLSLDKYKMNYGEVGAHIFIRYFYSNGLDFSNDFYKLSSNTSERLIFFRSKDFLKLSEKLLSHASSLDYLKGEISDFIQSSGKKLSRSTGSYDYLLFSSFSSDNVIIPELLDDKGKKWLNSISRFWRNLVFGDSDVYKKFLSVFEGEFKEYVAKTISISKPPSGYESFSLPFGYFNKGTRSLAFEGNSVGGGVGLFSYNGGLSSNTIGHYLPRLLIFKGDNTPEERYGDVFPEILGCFDFYFNVDKDKDVIVIPVESENEEGEKTLILHTFYVGTLLDDHFRFYVDGRKKVNKEKINEYWNSEYKFNLYPNQKDEGKGKVVLDVEEKIGIDLSWADKEEGVEELLLKSELLLSASSFGEVVRVGGKRGLVPRGARITKGGTLLINELSLKLDPSVFDSINLDRGSLLSPKWDEGFSDAFILILERVEKKFMSSLPGFRFIYSQITDENKTVKELAFRYKKFLLSAIELVFRESLRIVKKMAQEEGEIGSYKTFNSYKDDMLLYAYITDNVKTYNFGTWRSFTVGVPFDNLVSYQNGLFKGTKPYSRFIDHLDPNLCFDYGNLRVNVSFSSISDKEVKELVKRKSYRAFVEKSLPGKEKDLNEDQVDVYSLFLDLLPQDSSSVKYLYFKGLHEIFRSRGEVLKRIMGSFVDPLDLGVIETKWEMDIEIKIAPAEGKEDKVYYVIPKDKYRVGDKVHEETFISDLRNYRFEYKIGKNSIEILG